MTEHLLKKTVVQEGNFLTPEIVAITACEPVSENSEKFFLYSYMRISFDLAGVLMSKIVSEKQYLRGTVEGIEQVIKLELPAEAIEDEQLIESFHSILTIYADAEKAHISSEAMLKLAEKW